MDEMNKVNCKTIKTSIICCQSLFNYLLFRLNIFFLKKYLKEREAVVAGWTESKGETEGSLHSNFQNEQLSKDDVLGELAP